MIIMNLSKNKYDISAYFKLLFMKSFRVLFTENHYIKPVNGH